MNRVATALSGILPAMVILITTSQPLHSRSAADTAGQAATTAERQPGTDHDTVSVSMIMQPQAEPDSVKHPDPVRSLSRPVLGLALSGGGAKGLAHLGIIKVMEEAGLKPDYISGVSMGSIVGAMYAMGYTPDSIAHMFRSFDWESAMSDRINENKIIFPEKKYFHNSLIALPITRNAIKIPSGLISGQQIESGLNHYFWPAALITDFSKLPIPFLCLATDVVTTRRVVFTGGYLPDAIRASIAIPSIFTPVRTDTAVLVDGGVVRNYAASELREAGADIIIGSYVSFKGYGEKDLESAYGILKQIGFLTSLADYEDQKRQTDIMIEPELGDIGTMSYGDADSIMEKGYREALKYSNVFRRLADSLDSFGPRKPVTPMPEVRYYRFDSIRVTGNRLISEEQIIGVLDVRPGVDVDREFLEEQIDLLYGKNWFEKVRYRIIPGDKNLILEIDCIERPRGMLYGSLHYDPSLSTGAVVRFSIKDLLTPRSVISLDTYIGQYYRVRMSAMQFIDRSQKFGIEGSFFSDYTRLPLISLRNETGPMISQNYITSMTLSKRLSLNHLMTFSTTFENLHLTPDYVTATGIRKLSYDYLRFGYSYQANTIDRKHFPDKGVISGISFSTSKLLRAARRDVSARTVYGPDDEESPFIFDRNYVARAWFKSYTSTSDRLTVNIGGEFLFTTGTDSITSGNDFWLLGGLEATTDRSIAATGFHPNQITVRNLGGVSFGTDIEILTDLHLILDFNLFALTEPDREYGFTIMGGYGIGAGYMTLAGPLRIGIMHGFYDRQLLYKSVKGYISMGFTF